MLVNRPSYSSSITFLKTEGNVQLGFRALKSQSIVQLHIFHSNQRLNPRLRSQSQHLNQLTQKPRTNIKIARAWS